MNKVKKAVLAGLVGSLALVVGTVFLLSNQSNDSVNANVDNVYTNKTKTEVQEVPKDDLEKVDVQDTDTVEVIVDKDTSPSDSKESENVALPKDKKEADHSVVGTSNEKVTSSTTVEQDKQTAQSNNKAAVSTSTTKKDTSVSSQGTFEKQKITTSSKPNVTKTEPKKQVSQPTQPKAEPKNEVKPQPKPQPKPESKPVPKPVPSKPKEPAKPKQEAPKQPSQPKNEGRPNIDHLRPDTLPKYVAPEDVNAGSQPLEDDPLFND